MRKSGAPREIPPPLELECLKALWKIGDGTVKDVRQVLIEHRNLAYTTVMTVLDRLVRRGSVERQKCGRSFVYTPRLGREELRRLAVKELVDSFFDGSTEELVAYLRGGAVAEAKAPSRKRTSEEEEGLDTALL